MFFNSVVDGSKKFEYRLNDRDYCIGDRVVLMDYNPEKGVLTGRAIAFTIGYILDSSMFFDIYKNYVILSISYLSCVYSLKEPF